MECVGKLIGKALAEGILLDVNFAPFFLTKVLNRPTTRTRREQDEIRCVVTGKSRCTHACVFVCALHVLRLGAFAVASLATLDAELYKQLLFLKRYEGDPADLALTFAVHDDSQLGSAVRPAMVDLRNNGSNLDVNRGNCT